MGGQSVDLRKVHRVLLVRTNVRLGNLLLITPALAAMRRALPEARIDVLCDAAYGCLLTSDRAVNDVIPIDRRVMRHPLALARLLHRLRSAHYDLVLDCARGGSFLGALFTRLTAGRLRVASADGRYGRFFNVHVRRRADRSHKVDLLLDLLAGIGIPAASDELRVVLTEGDRMCAARRWASWGLDADRLVVGINLGGRGRKQWPLGRFVELAKQLRLTCDVGVAFFAGPEDQDRLAQVRADLPAEVVVAPLLPVRDFAALLARCTVVVTCDTGPMHLAAAVGTPTVAILQAPSSPSYVPRGSFHRGVHAVGGPSVALVLDAVREVLALARSPEGDRGGRKRPEATGRVMR